MTAVLFVIGLVGNTATTMGMDPFVAPLPQLAAQESVAAALTIAAFRLPAPAVVLGVIALVAGAVFWLACGALATWPGVAVLVAHFSAGVPVRQRENARRSPVLSRPGISAVLCGALG